MKKRVRDIEQALRWAWRDELIKRGEEWGGQARYAPGFSPAAIAGVSGSSFSFSDPIPPSDAEPHPDALALEAAVNALAGKGFGFDASLRIAELGPDCAGMIAAGDPTLSHFAIPDIVPLIVMHARMGTRPTWEASWLIQPVRSERGEHVVIGSKVRSRHYESGAHCPLSIRPEPREVVSDRAEYACWRAALTMLAGDADLAMRLKSFDISGPAAPERPWVDPEVKPTILRDLTKDWGAPPESARLKRRRRPMAKQLIMDHTGHSTHIFDPKDSLSTGEAMQRFAELTGKGYTAAKLLDDGAHEVIHAFDPAAEQTLFFPHLQGG